ncbi:MAG TPA: VWA domain-containing protein [Acidobacteriaceae bacterium]|jgi:VWFA-related protein
MGIAQWIGLAGLVLSGIGIAAAQEASPAGSTETLHTTTQLVVLDATVLDKKGQIVNVPLGRDDFQIEEDKKPQTIRYFESAAEHSGSAAGDEGSKVPRLIVVLDELNFTYHGTKNPTQNLMDQFADYTYMRRQLLAYLQAQPEQLLQPTEVLALTHSGFQVVSTATRNRNELIRKVERRDPGLGTPYRDFIEQRQGDGTLTKGSLQAMWALALPERAEPGRKIVVWLGYGGPSQALSRPINARDLPPFLLYVREVTDLLVDARITLDLITPGLQTESAANSDPLAQALANMSRGPSESDFGFSSYVHITGGLFKRGNDVAGEIQSSETYGTTYYTLSYSPSNHDLDRSLRRLKVTVKNHPEWLVLTKEGYYALQYGGEKDFQHQLQADLSIATFEGMPFSAIEATLMQVERVKDAYEKDGVTTRFVLDIQSDDLQWRTDSATGKREAEVAVSAAALGKRNAPLNSKVGEWKLTEAAASSSDAPLRSTVTLQFRVPPKTERIRFAVRDIANGRMGTTQVTESAIRDAPLYEPDAKPTLQPRPPTPAKQ